MRVLIVGAGPAGLLLANYLIRRPGYDIHIIERQPDPQQTITSSSSLSSLWSYPIVLQSRGLDALRYVDPTLETAIEQQGIYAAKACFHKSGGKVQTFPKDPPMLSVDRNKITMTLLDQLRRQQSHHHHSSSQSKDDTSSTLSIDFNCALETIDFDQQIASVITTTTSQNSNDNKNNNGEKKSTISYDHLVAADGPKSIIRHELVQRGKLQAQLKETPEQYRTIVLSRTPTTTTASDLDPHNNNNNNDNNNKDDDSSSTSAKKKKKKKQKQELSASPPPLEADCLHGWMLGDSGRVLAAPMNDEYVSGAYIFEKGHDPFLVMDNNKEEEETDNSLTSSSSSSSSTTTTSQKKKEKKQLTTPQDVRDYFDEISPNSLAPLITDQEGQNLLNKSTLSLVSVRCNQLHADHNILLLGDAAHAAVGHGCNAALQDVQVFGTLLDKQQQQTNDSDLNNNLNNTHWESTLQLYTESRLKDVMAMVDLSDYSMPRNKLMKVEWMTRIILKKILPNVEWIQKRFLKPMPMDLLSETNLPYSTVLEQTKWWIDRIKQCDDQEESDQEEEGK